LLLYRNLVRLANLPQRGRIDIIETPSSLIHYTPMGQKCKTESRSEHRQASNEATDMELSRLLTDLSHKEVHGRVGVDIDGLAHDSRQVRPGDLFVAVKGLDAGGHDFIPDAIRQGAVAVVGERA
jgi:hypothetical protein